MSSYLPARRLASYLATWRRAAGSVDAWLAALEAFWDDLPLDGTVVLRARAGVQEPEASGWTRILTHTAPQPPPGRVSGGVQRAWEAWVGQSLDGVAVIEWPLLALLTGPSPSTRGWPWTPTDVPPALAAAMLGYVALAARLGHHPDEPPAAKWQEDCGVPELDSTRATPPPRRGRASVLHWTARSVQPEAATQWALDLGAVPDASLLEHPVGAPVWALWRAHGLHVTAIVEAGFPDLQLARWGTDALTQVMQAWVDHAQCLEDARIADGDRAAAAEGRSQAVLWALREANLPTALAMGLDAWLDAHPDGWVWTYDGKQPDRQRPLLAVLAHATTGSCSQADPRMMAVLDHLVQTQRWALLAPQPTAAPEDQHPFWAWWHAMTNDTLAAANLNQIPQACWDHLDLSDWLACLPEQFVWASPVWWTPWLVWQGPHPTAVPPTYLPAVQAQLAEEQAEGRQPADWLEAGWGVQLRNSLPKMLMANLGELAEQALVMLAWIGQPAEAWLATQAVPDTLVPTSATPRLLAWVRQQQLSEGPCGNSRPRARS